MIEVKEEEQSDKDKHSSGSSSIDDEMTMNDKMKLDREIIYERILEKITDKVTNDPQTTEFKKELLIRIALYLEEIDDDDLISVEHLIDDFNKNDEETKKKIIELFSEKYHINLTDDLEKLMEEYYSKVEGEKKTSRIRNVRAILAKKLKLLAMLSKLCKPSAKLIDARHRLEASENLLAALLGEDINGANNYDDDVLNEEDIETVNDMIKRLFSKNEDELIAKLKQYKKGLKFMFGV